MATKWFAKNFTINSQADEFISHLAFGVSCHLCEAKIQAKNRQRTQTANLFHFISFAKVRANNVCVCVCVSCGLGHGH